MSATNSSKTPQTYDDSAVRKMVSKVKILSLDYIKARIKHLTNARLHGTIDKNNV